jgi:hypothetical protein
MISIFYYIAQLQAFLVACYYYRYIKHSFMKWFMPFLGFVLLAGLSIRAHVILRLPPPVLIAYLLQVVQTAFYGYLFFKLSTNKIIRRLVILMCAICIPTYVLNFFLSGNATSANLLVAVIITSIFMTVISVLYLYLLIIENENIRLVKEPGWWIATGISIFFSCTCVAFLLYDFILSNRLILFGMYLYNLIPRLMSLILYSFISISIVLYARRAKQKLAYPC